MHAAQLRKYGWCLFALVVWLTGTATSQAQQANVGVPFRNVGTSFNESVNLGWGIRGPGASFQFNGNAQPAFGGFDPNAQATLGGGLVGGPFSGFFRLTAGEGSNTTFGSQTGSLTTMNGVPGYFADQSLRPFVTSVSPIVADPSPLRERLRRRATELQAARTAVDQAESKQPIIEKPVAAAATGRSSAEAGATSVAAIKAQQAAEGATQAAELENLIAKARAAREESKPGVARIFFQQALRRASGEQAQAIRQELSELAAP